MFRNTPLAIILALVLITTTPGISLAQEEEVIPEPIPAPTAELSGPLSFSFSPENPAPKTSTTVRLTSFGVNLTSASIRWTVDGKVVLTGIGATSYTFTTKTSGSATAISVTVTPAVGEPVTAKNSIVPGGADILWQAIDAIVPPLYRGKALPTTESTIRYVAMTDIRSATGRIASGDLVYTWRHNNTLNQKASGYGKFSHTVQGSYLDSSQKVDVEITSKDETITANSSVSIGTVTPKIVWYTTSSLYGPRFDKALVGNHIVSGSDVSLLAMPYFFSPNNPTSPRLSYVWSINGQNTETPSTPNMLFLRKEEGGEGLARIGLSIENVSTLFQEASANLAVTLQ